MTCFCSLMFITSLTMLRRIVTHASVGAKCHTPVSSTISSCSGRFLGQTEFLWEGCLVLNDECIRGGWDPAWAPRILLLPSCSSDRGFSISPFFSVCLFATIRLVSHVCLMRMFSEVSRVHDGSKSPVLPRWIDKEGCIAWMKWVALSPRPSMNGHRLLAQQPVM